MPYCVFTYLVAQSDGRISGKATIPCADRAEAHSMASALDGKEGKTFARRAMPCVTGYSEAGKFTIPVDQLIWLRAEAKAD